MKKRRVPGPFFTTYVEHRLGDAGWFDAAVARHGVPALVAAAIVRIEAAASARDWPRASKPGCDAMGFLRDAGIGVFPGHQAAFRRAMSRSRLFDALERCLDARVFAVRSAAVFAFGKLSFRVNASRLRRALERRKDRDPLLVPPLLFELAWLEGPRARSRHWARMRALAASPHPLTRWAVAAVIGDSSRERRVAIAIARGLRRDPSPLVRGQFRRDARRRFEGLEHGLDGPDYTVEGLLARLLPSAARRPRRRPSG